jgi:hypothetical protein
MWFEKGELNCRRKVIRSKILRSTDVWEFDIKVEWQRRH